jgi:hypothetical protein
MALQFLALPVIIGAAVTTWATRQIATVAAKLGFTSFQTGIAVAILALNIFVIGSYVAIVYQIYQLFQTALDWFFSLAVSDNEIVRTSFDVVKSLGVWDGILDALALVLPILELIILIKLSRVLLKLLDRFNETTDRIIKTILSYGL